MKDYTKKEIDGMNKKIDGLKEDMNGIKNLVEAIAKRLLVAIPIKEGAEEVEEVGGEK